MSRQHREALAHLMFGVRSSGGFAQLTGEVGTGKTTICRCLIERLPEEVDVALILNPRVTALELVATVCDELKVEYPEGIASIKVLTDVLNTYLLKNHAAGQRTVLIIDEAQCLSAEALEQVRLLTNLETSTTKLLQIILVGQPELRELLAREDLRQLAQRITARFHLMPFSRVETAAYIRHRLQLVGCRGEVFGERVIDMVHQLANGVPRLINVLCDRAMLGAFAEGVPVVDTKIMRKAAAEVLPGAKRDGALPRSLWRGLALVLMLGLGLATGLWYGVTLPDDALINSMLPATVTPSSEPPLPASAPSERSSTPGPAQRAEAVAEMLPASHAMRPEQRPQPPAPAIAIATPVPGPVVPGPAVSEPAMPGPGVPEPAAPEPAAPEPVVSEPASTAQSAPAALSLAGYLDAAGAGAAARAWAGLYRLWGYDSAAATDEQACAQAAAAGLSCLVGAGSWGLLSRFDRPAILLLRADDGRRVAAVMQQVEGDKVMLEIDGEAVQVQRSELEQRWQGAYRLLWKNPPSGKRGLWPGMRSSDVQWLRERLAQLNGRETVAANPVLYDESLKSQVRELQIRYGLDADGVAGPHTLIVLNNLLADSAIPYLTRPATALME